MHLTPTSGTLKVINENGELIRISSEEYKTNRHLYKTPSSGYVSVRNKITNKCYRILIEDYDSNIHKKVFGGIVVEKNGKRQYIDKDEFISGKYKGIHKGKVTVIELSTGIRKHITKEEYKTNRHLYKQNTEGFVTGINKITKEKIRLTCEEAKELKNEYMFSTAGQLTVFDIKTNKFKNIIKTEYNSDNHHLAQDKMFICYNSDGSRRFKFWGARNDFLKKYNTIYKIWQCILKNEVVPSNIRKNKEFCGCYFKIINWKGKENVLKMWEEL